MDVGSNRVFITIIYIYVPLTAPQNSRGSRIWLEDASRVLRVMQSPAVLESAQFKTTVYYRTRSKLRRDDNTAISEVMRVGLPIRGSSSYIKPFGPELLSLLLASFIRMKQILMFQAASAR